MCLNQRRRDRLDIEQKYCIVMESVRCPHLTQKELGEWAQKEFNLHHSVKQKTISNIMNAKSKVIKAYEEGNLKGKTSSRLLTIPDLENDMLEYVQDMAARHIPINRPTAKAYARVLAASKYRMNEMRRDKRLGFSDRWLTDLLNRIGVKTRYLYGEISSVDLTSANIGHHRPTSFLS
ncbi:Homeodomain-like DNA binding domain-containing transcription factor [Mucor lusitanicus CBS 277.49]|uniref:Homeodomain-like DNA binding domain-containing transcription factor n=1 Tax=Mucor lusitanicus CBS 277.49 TaxID=747725 RepID=A0A162QXL6_MUCCL|nr:Homeodomain-like DNA binding domain-containing transcription factor [Mucor lusitanicus CBS 277.49]